MKANNKGIDHVQLKTCFDAEFFAPGVMRLPVVWDDSIPTACTDGKRIKWNPKHFEQCSEGNAVMVMCEEVGHCLLGHLWRYPAEARSSAQAWQHWNWCCDQEVRNMLREFSELRKAKNLADPFPFPEPKDAYLPDPKYAGMSVEAIWRATWNPQEGGADGQGQGQGQGQGKSHGGNAGDGAQGRAGQAGEFEQPMGDAGEQAKARADWESTMIQSARMCGDLPGSIKRAIGEIVSPAVPWWELLRSLLREVLQDDYDLMRPNLPLTDGSGFICAGLHSEAMGPAVFAIDASGSIDREMFTRFVSEAQHFLDDSKPRNLKVIACDTRINGQWDFSPGEQVNVEVSAGGGTDFSPVFDLLEQGGERPRVLVYLTDLDGQFPDMAPDYPVIWVTWESGGKAPFGEVVYCGD